MALEVVKQVAEIERQADEIIKAAQQKANDILKSAKEKYDLMLKDANLKGNEFYRETINRFEDEGKGEARPIYDEANRTIENIKNISNEKIEKAINMVIERIVNSHGDS
ncbi:MAG: ATPase [Caloramator sp.]|nr:ATPase [Caloramator sp.]